MPTRTNSVVPVSGVRGVGSLLVLVGVLAVLGHLNDAIGLPVYDLVLAGTVLFWITQATSWNLLSGYAGYFSFGQGGYVGVGAYAMAVLTGRHGVNYLVSILVGGLLAAVLAAVVGALAFRLRSLRGEIFALLTLAVPFILAAFARINSTIDGGQGTTLPLPDFPGWVGDFQHLLFYLNLAVATIAVAVALLTQRSRFGRGLAAIHDAEDAAEVVGVPTFRYKMLAIVIGGAIGGMGGALLALQVGFVAVETIFNLTIPLTVIVISVLGGRRHWMGPVVGAVLIVVLQDRLASAGLTAWSPVILGGLLAVLVVLAPDGMYTRLRAHPWIALGAFVVATMATALIGGFDHLDALLFGAIAAVVVATVAAAVLRARRAQATPAAAPSVTVASEAVGHPPAPVLVASGPPTEPTAANPAHVASAAASAPDPTHSPPLLECRDLARNFGGVRALQGVSLSVWPREIVGMVGPNGSGKTTLVNLLSGALPVSGGSIRLSGRPTTGLPPHRVAHAGVARTYQIPKPFDSMTVLDNVAMAVMFGRRATALEPARTRAADALAAVGLVSWAANLPTELNLHQRLMLEIARAIAADPLVLLLDEALAGLSPAEIDEAVAVIRRIHARGISIIVVEHLLRVLHQLATRIVVLDRGRVIADGLPAAVLSDPAVVEAYLGRQRA